MKKIIIVALLALGLSGCATTQNPVQQIAQTGNAMLDAKEDYELARYQLELSLDRLPEDVAYELLTLEDEIQRYIKDVEQQWQQDKLTTLASIDRIYTGSQRGQSPLIGIVAQRTTDVGFSAPTRSVISRF